MIEPNSSRRAAAFERTSAAGNQQRAQQRMNKQQQRKVGRLLWITQVKTGEGCDHNQEIDLRFCKRPVIA